MPFPLCRVIPNVAGDWQILPPEGKITQIGDAGGPLTLALDSNADFNASGKCEVAGDMYIYGVSGPLNACELEGSLQLNSPARILQNGANGEVLILNHATEEMTINVGEGAAGEWGPTWNILPADAIILAVVTRITQAPGGGATLLYVGQFPGDWQKFVDAKPVNLGDQTTWAADGSGVDAGPIHMPIADLLMYMTNNNVTISPMKIRTTSFYLQMFPPIA